MGRGKSSSTGRQHYVPRFYLQNFGFAPAAKSKARHVFVRDLTDARIFSASVRDVACEPRFYDAVNDDGSLFSADPALTELEDLVAPACQRLVEDTSPPNVIRYGGITATFKQLTDDDFWALSLFCATLMTRTTGFRKRLRDSHNNMLDHARIMQQRLLPNRPESIDHLRLEENTLIRDTGEATLGLALGLANILRHRIWIVSTVPSGIRLITSDDPVIRVCSDNMIETERLIPMSPTKLLGFVTPEHPSDPSMPRYQLHQLTIDEVARLNCQQRQQAVRFLFAHAGIDLSAEKIDDFSPS